MLKKLVLGTALSLLLSPAVTASALDLSYPGDPLDSGPDVFNAANSFSPGLNGSLSGNNVTVTGTPGNTLTGNVFGGQSNTVGNDVFNNNVTISGGVIGDGAITFFIPPYNLQADPEAGGGLTADLPNKGSVFGGVATGADAYGNKLTVTGGDILGAAIGGFVPIGSAGNVYDNQVLVSGGSIAYELNGATTDKGNAANNRVTISGGTIKGWVHGASSLFGAGTVANNTVAITGGQFTNSGVIVPRIYGGISESGLAENNMVLISGLANPAALADRAIYGGGSILGDVDGNAITITNTPGFQAHSLSGGFGGEKSLNKTATNNTVSLIDSNDFAITTWIRGGRLLDGGAGTSGMNDGNTLNFIRSGGQVGGIAFFENYNFDLPNSLTTAEPLVHITGNVPVDLNDTNVDIQALQSGGQIFQPGDTLTLIDQTVKTVPIDDDINLSTGLIDYNFNLFTDDALRMRLTSAAVNPGGGGSLPAGPGAAIGFLGQGGDLIADLLIEPAERRKMPTIFAVVTGSDITYNSHPELDVRGWSLVTGVDWNHTTDSCDELNLAAYFETGHGNYDSHGRFAGLDVRADGDLRYVGGGLLGRLDLASGWYVEGSARAGQADLDFRSGAIRDAAGKRARYDYSAPYYGAHAGLGYAWQIDDCSALDLYGKYLWVRLQGDDVTVLNTKVSFDDQDSQRARAGARYSRSLSPEWSLYGGAAYEYEFSAKADGNISIYNLKTTDLTGGTGVGEAGFAYQNGGFSAELGVKGFVGERQGLGGRLMIGYNF